MKKIILLLLICILLSGCSISTIKLNSVDNIIDQVLLKDSDLKNASFNGYSYYIPNTLKIVSKTEYNTVLQDEFSNMYYVYSDVVSYYNKVENSYKEDNKAYYSKKIISKKNKKDGYVEINEIKDNYFVEAVYNYGKIEVYTKKKYLNQVVTNISQVLSSLKYNDKVLSTLIGENVLDYKEESFNIFTTKKSTSNYLDYIEQFDKASDSDIDLPDDYQIDISTGE